MLWLCKMIFICIKPVKLDCKGAIVKDITTLLAKKGSSVKVTDTYHIGVRSAVVAFQKKNNLEPTGIIDKNTWIKLNR